MLLLHPAESPEDDLKADLVDECFCKCKGTYEALSYTWGTEDAFHTLNIGGHDHSIRPNLFHALRRLRAACQGTTRRLWIDALCIDQFDLHERTRQVKRMREVYGNASRVVAWLGEDSSEGLAWRPFNYERGSVPSKVSDFERALKSTIAEYDAEVDPRTKPPGPGWLPWAEHNTFKMQKRVLPYSPEPYLETDVFINLFARRWFRRRWVVQEIAASKGNVLVMYGSESYDWATLEYLALRSSLSPNSATKLFHRPLYWKSTLQIFSLPFSAVGSVQSPCDSTTSSVPLIWWDGTLVWSSPAKAKGAKGINPPRFGTPTQQAAQAVRNMDQFHDFECSDDRDRIAALNGLQFGLVFEIDYAATVEDNYIAFAAAIIRNGALFRLLRSAACRNKLHRDQHRLLPSWVPDWRISIPPDLDLAQLDDLTPRDVPFVFDGAHLLIPTSRVRLISAIELQYLTEVLGFPGSSGDTMLDCGSLCLDIMVEDPYHGGREPCSIAKGAFVLRRQANDQSSYELLTELPAHDQIVPLLKSRQTDSGVSEESRIRDISEGVKRLLHVTAPKRSMYNTFNRVDFLEQSSDLSLHKNPDLDPEILSRLGP